MELAERMQKTKLGQVTWINPDLVKTCLECKHAQLAHQSVTHTHVCKLVKVHTKKTGVAIDARRAIACSMFAGVDTESRNT